MMELMYKCIKQPESNPDLFYFAEDALMQLDSADEKVTAGFAIYFALHLTSFFGFQINNEQRSSILDLQEGSFVTQYPQHAYYTDGKNAELIFELLKIMQPHEIPEVAMNHLQRRAVLESLETYYALHISEFGKMKSLPVLQQVLE
jgi:DNA repair protein RecO (recombination protein O)